MSSAWRDRCSRGLGAFPPPTKPRPAGVWSLLKFAGSGQGRSRLGEGQGGGMQQGSCVRATPSPTLPRKRGRGQTESAALVSAESPAILGQKPHSSQAKQRIGSLPGICYDSGAHLL